MIYLVLLLSLLLRIISINQSLWLDEATTGIVSQLSMPDFFSKFIVNDFHPPLYYLVIHLWSIAFGFSEIALRVPSIIFGILTVYATYLIARKLNFKNAYYPAILLATSGLHIYYSQEARMYAMVTWLISYLVLSFINKKWVIFSLILPLIFLTDYLATFVLPVLFIYTVIYSRENIKKFLLSTTPLVVTFLVWFPTFLNQLTNGLAVKTNSGAWWDALGPVTLKNIVLIPVKFIVGRISIENDVIYALVSLFLICFVFYFIFKAKTTVLKYWFFGSLIVGILVSFFVPTLTYFRYLFVLPAFYLLISENINKKAFYFLMLINILASSSYLFNNKFHREDWRQMAKVIGDEKIVLPAASQKEALIYYGKDGQIVNRELLTTNNKKIWLSRYVTDIFDPNDSTRKYIENLGYNWSEEVSLNGLVFWKYIKY